MKAGLKPLVCKFAGKWGVDWTDGDERWWKPYSTWNDALNAALLLSRVTHAS